MEGERASYGADLSAERPMLLDPCRDDPVDHLAFQPDGTVLALSRRGETTIRVLNLNRKPLAEARRRTYDLIEVQLQVRGQLDVAELVARGEPYVAVALAALRAHEADDAAGGGGFAVPEEMRSADRVIAEDDEAFRLSARALREVEIKNFGIIQEMRIAMPEPGGDRAPWLVLLGENASGKSTVLRAIGLALAGAEAASRYTRPDRVV